MSDDCNPFSADQFTECNKYAGRNENIPSAKERGEKSIYRIKNPYKKYVLKFLVDGCLLKRDINKKCDYLYIDCDNQTVYLVELKGRDLNHAIAQIESTLNLLGNSITRFKVVARIVLSSTPPTRVINQQKEYLIKILKNWENNSDVPVSKLYKTSTVLLEEII